jgi:signal transduction histidine kinase
MKRPWQIGLTFAGCLVVTLAAMGWLTVTALELDRTELAARRHAELEEKVSLALWRMDTLLAPLLAQEAARPHFVYRPFLSVPGDKTSQPKLVPSPLLRELPEHVLLNFQWSADDQWTSPQVPPAEQNDFARQNDVSEQFIASNGDRLAQLMRDVDERQLLAMLPTVELPVSTPTESLWGSNVKLGENPAAMIDNSLSRPARPAEGSSSAVVPKDGRGQAETDLSTSPPQAARQSVVGQEPAGQQAALAGPAPQQPEPPSRDGREWLRRNQFYQSYAKQAFEQQRAARTRFAPEPLVREGISRPVWVKSHLLLARRVTVGDEVRVQGSWLDWPHIRQLLLAEVSEVLDGADVVPVTTARRAQVPGRMLATLPVELLVPAPDISPGPYSALRVALWLAWACLIMATGALGALLVGLIALSERRGAFVSAVTHELRTPLTTFRMYAEMLAEGMVPDPATRQSYLRTLQREADRLSHLVENVLSYARLERGKARGHREFVSVAELIDRVTSRLAERAEQANKRIVPLVPEPVRTATIHADTAAVEQILFNLVDNACKYAAAAADDRIELAVTKTRGHLQFAVADHGPGLSADAAAHLFRPFSKSSQAAAESAPGVGLGLALCRRLARQIGGRLSCDTGYRGGARFVLALPCPGE